jgi:hypothetical protein
MNTVKKKGCNFADDEIFNMAIHYYDEQKIEVTAISGNVVVNHHVVITEEEKAAMKQNAATTLFQMKRED